MIPDSDFIWVSFFLAQRPTKADFSAAPRCHSTWRNARGEAQLALGRVDGIASLLSAPEQLLYSYVRKEAVSFSQIEGTPSSLSDLRAYEITAAPGIPAEDVREVSDCVAAYEHADQRMSGGFLVSLRLICEAHEKLLASGRSKDQSPGPFRRSQNWSGTWELRGVRFPTSVLRYGSGHYREGSVAIVGL